MTAKELIEKLSKVSPDTEIVGGMFNGRVNTYTVLDDLHVFSFDDIFADFYGTPGAFDDKLLNIRSKNVVYLGPSEGIETRGMLNIRSKNVVYLGSTFDSLDKQVQEDRRVICQL